MLRTRIGSTFADRQLKVGADAQDDLRRGLLIRSIIDNPDNMPKDKKIDPASIANKNAGPTGCVLMVDANRKSFMWLGRARAYITQRSGMSLRLSST